ncbi:MAG: type II restriction endonuclease, partial [Microscillaceae bacterium]|nr:type II restriction endonuclease [Microscillaceae bacterium]MDW8459712.1 type II restriction endonuclease [Cytophagales bacterium]
MIAIALKIRHALNKAFLRLKPTRTQIDAFKQHLRVLFSQINEQESEEFHKNLLAEFLKQTYYQPNYFINTKGRNDLVIHRDKTPQSPVAVLMETKKPTNHSEMPSPDNLNAKAFHELILYFLRERFTHNNLEIKHLIITNLYQWFIFEGSTFERIIAQNQELVSKFNDFEAGRLIDNRTEFFYKQIAEPWVAQSTAEIKFTYFDLRTYRTWVQSENKEDDKQLIPLFKIFSPEHLLHLPFANDSNTLDQDFYNELLHIMGLTEVQKGGKKLIERNQPKDRHPGSILENTITQLETLDKLNHLPNLEQFGDNPQEQLFGIALELTITWINRILFLKLLEAQLLQYHEGNAEYAFLSPNKIKNLGDLNSLFFQVLARKPQERNAEIRQDFEKVPYLNSALFEPTELEQTALFISNLQDNKSIPLHPQTVLKDRNGNRLVGKLPTLPYLLQFLDAYDFGAEGNEEIQEQNKTLINAAVLGLIFEKINGYKEGSFFTPGFITMYMCRETIRKAVLQKFNEVKGWRCQTFEDLYNHIEDRHEANEIVNSLKICDNAVGSGHFLVSALNEIIAIKNDLKILLDRNGKRLKEYH